MGRIKSKDTQMYAVVPDISPAVLLLGCITAIDGLGGAANQIDTTCFSSQEMEYEAGLPNPGQVTVSGIYDSTDDVFPQLVTLKESGDVVGWYIGGSDGTDPPTEGSAGDVVEAPTTRTGVEFRGYVADVTWTMAANNVWRWTLVIQRTGPWTLTRKAP
jgi:hypothetical protein